MYKMAVEGVTNFEVDVRRDGKAKCAPEDLVRCDVMPSP